MKAGLEIKISNYTLYAMIAAVLIVLAMFFFVGFGNNVAVLKKIAPNSKVEYQDASGNKIKCADGDFVPHEAAKKIQEESGANAEFELNADKSFKLLSSPEYTDKLIYLMYILTIVPIVIIVIYAIWNLVLRIIDNPSKAFKSLIPLLLFIALVGICYACAGTDSVIVNEELYEDSFWLKWTSAFLLIQYVLLVLCVVLTIVSLSGVVKYLINKVKYS